MNIATAFSGGLAAPEFALKYENIPHKVIFACEWDKYAREQYLHFHGTPQTFYDDIKDLKATKYKDIIDLFVWGSPCQDVSVAGARKGFAGEQSIHFFEGLRVQGEMKPKIFIFENVKGLLSSNNGADFKTVIESFRAQGYHIAYKVMNTKDYGIPQNRERIFIVGFLDVEHYHRFNFEEPIPLKLRLKDLLDSEVEDKYYLSQKMIHSFTNSSFIQERNRLQESDICGTLLSRDYKSPKLVQIGNIDTKGHNSIWGRVYDPNGISATLNAQGGGMGAKTGLYLTNELIFAGGINKPRKGMEKEKHLARAYSLQDRVWNSEGISPTIMSQECQGRYHTLVKNRIRRLTPKECFKLQGVRDKDIDLIVSDTQAYKIAGNAISVNVMQSLLRSLYKQQATTTTLF